MKSKKLMFTLAFLTLLTIYALITPASKEKAGPSKNDSVGILQFVTHLALDEITEGVKIGLSESGHKDVKINFYNGEGDQSKLQTLSSELVGQDNKVLVGIATPAVQSLANATKTTPIIMGAVSDPIGANLLSNLDKPEKNVSGVSDRFPTNEQVKLMKDLMPNLSKVGVIYSSSEDNSKSQVEEFKKNASKVGIKVSDYVVPSTNEISTTSQVAAKDNDAIYIPMDNTIASAFSTVVDVASQYNKPIFPSVDSMVEEGGLAAVAINQKELGIETGKMAAEVLDGKEIKNMPVKLFSKVTPVVNKEVAKKLNIKVPDNLNDKVKWVK